MQTSNRILDDLARVASGAASTLVGVKGEIDALIRQRIEKLVINADLITRHEFDAVKDMASEARAEQDRLQKRIALLETQLAEEMKNNKSATRVATERPKTAKNKTSTRRKT
ncbi:MAG: hypothetical protein CBB68_14905 [Rhodospirillaceae bacterium TMED8]|nr:hypothetical protein [Magnetovibrio sp.]OUT47720.1 MAG: hypothetical protein CBB68_14905 [Rhodospirillaceae bacterium TMED8]